MERYIKDMEEAADKLLQWLQRKTNDIRLDIFPWNEILGKLKSDVLIIESNVVKFRQNFDSANATSNHFRKILLDKCREKNIDLDNLQRKDTATRKWIDSSPTVTLADKWCWDVDDEDLRDFRGCFIFAVDQPSLEEMSWVLRAELQRSLSSLGPRSITQQKAKLAEKIRLWYEETGEGSFLTQKNAEAFIGQSADSCAVDDFDTYIDRYIQIRFIPESVLGAREAQSFRICWTNEKFEEWKKNGNANTIIYQFRKNNLGQNILVKSHGGVDPLRQLTEKESSSYFEVEEEDVQKQMTEKIVIISDRAGMGKSTFLHRLWHRLKSANNDQWIIRIDLNDPDTREYIKKAREEQDVVLGLGRHILAYDDREIKDLTEDLEKVTILFDGFDEIPDETQQETLGLVDKLSATKTRQIWIATRPHFQNVLENRFGRFATTLKPFSEGNQVHFITKFWQKQLEQNQPREGLESKALNLVRLLARSIRDAEQGLTGIPLQCRMLAEAFHQKLPEELPDRLALTELYESFLDTKRRIFQNKLKINDGTMTAIAILIKQRVQKLAFDAVSGHDFFKENRYETDADEDDAVDKLLALFVLTTGPVHAPRFIHQTFAEYLVARNWVRKMRGSKAKWRGSDFHRPLAG